MIDDLETANALRDALDEEVAMHELAADSWPVIARRLASRPSWRQAVARLAPAVTAVVVAVAIVSVVIIDRPGVSHSSGAHRQPSAGSSWLKKIAVLSFSRRDRGPLRIASGYGAIWVGAFGVTYRVDPGTDQVADTISTPKAGRFSRVATGLGSVWVSGSNPQRHWPVRLPDRPPERSNDGRHLAARHGQPSRTRSRVRLPLGDV